MLRIILRIIAVLGSIVVVLIAAALIFVATRPDTIRVQRVVSIKASPEKIFPHIDDLRSFATWAPWEKENPAMKRTFSGAASGKGAVYEWGGGDDFTQGRMEIADSSPPSKVVIKVDFIQPDQPNSIVEFKLQAKGDATDVTWTMQSPKSFVEKFMFLFFDIDSIMGTGFEAGLANLKAIVEK
jgi:uncharacterized protein YndB with AHSA1/START domain